MPIPMTPVDCDLRDFAFMPLDVVRLRDSGLTAKATGDEFRCAVLLWCAAWHQVPAASLPNDDDELANICGYSRSRREWAKVRAGAMRGWVLCDDGRFYHQAVAVKALEAWIEKLASAIAGASGNAKRWGVKIETESMRAQFADAVALLRGLDGQSRTLKKKVVAVLTMPSPHDSADDRPPIIEESPPDPTPMRGGSPPDPTPIAPRIPPDSPPDRNRQGQGQGLEKQGPASKVIPIPGQGPPHALLARALVAEGISVNPSSPRLLALAEAGCPVATVEAAIAEAKKSQGDGSRIAANYVLAIVERWMAEQIKGPQERAAASPLTKRATAAWAQIVESVQRDGRNGTPKIDDPPANAALRAIGGYVAICNAREADMRSLSRRFTDAFADACRGESGEHEPIAVAR